MRHHPPLGLKALNCATVLGQELFTALLICPVADLGAVLADEDGIPVMCDITVGDVIGPLEKEGVIRVRDANFSLLSYSFSLVSSNLELWAGSAAMEGPGGVMHAMRRERHSRRSLPTPLILPPQSVATWSSRGTIDRQILTR